MKIALCDDEQFENDNLCDLIRKYAFKNNYEIRCETFTDGNELLKKDKYDLYFLDFCMDAMDGIELAQGLKKKFSHAVTICYLTNYDAAAAKIINSQIYADGFLKKPVDPRLLEEVLDRFYRMSFFKRYEFKQGRSFKTVYSQDILYVEADNKQVSIHFFDHVESFGYLLGEIEKILADRQFCRIHRSFIVNLQHVDSYDSKSVTLKNGETLPLKSKDFQRAFHEYMFLFNN